MKKQIIIWSKILVAACLLSSCSDFLKEEQTTSRSMDYYKTEEGIEALSVATYYQVLSAPFGAESYYCYTNYGTDEFQEGGDGSNAMFNSYDVGLASVTAGVNSNTVKADAIWNGFYLGIGYANLLIESADECATTNEQVKNVNLGEGYFFRAYNYLRLVSQFGGVPLKLKSSKTVELEFTRASVQEVYAQVIDDLTQAYNLLPAKASTFGKLDKTVAAHYLAKAYLSRSSEINDDWNTSTKKADLEKVVSLSNEVIAAHPLTDNFKDLWAFTGSGCANEQLNEIILSAQFSNDNAYSGKNLQHLYYLSRYDDLTYMQRDLTGGRPYSRIRTSYYMFRVYDLVNDSRFWKSFKTKNLVNKASGNYYKNGDLGIMYVVNQPGDKRFSSYYEKDKVVYEKTGKTIPHVYVAYPDGTTEDGALYEDVRFPSLNKYIDGSRLNVNETKGYRNVILARSAETYLMAAEAEVRLGNYTKALEYINPVRQRAAYKQGEDREAYEDGGAAYVSSSFSQDISKNSYMPENSYYESNGIAKTTDATDLSITDIRHLPAQDEYIIQKLGYTTDYDRMLCLVLDERSRELAGEFHRWEDLARTKTLVARAKAFNTQAAQYIKEHHYLRPIPQTYLDGIQKEGRPLTNEEKQAQQNPGY